MLLFKPEHVPLILDGTKTETRRLWWDHKKNQLAEKPRFKFNSIQKAKTQMLSKDWFAKIKILHMWIETLEQISDAGILAEGYQTREEYYNIFCEINKCELAEVRSKPLWCIRFEVIEVNGLFDTDMGGA